MENFPIYSDEDRVTYLAYYYERLAWHLLGIPPVSPNEWLIHRGTNPFDIDCDDLDCMVEVKAMSNNDQLKLFKDQLETQLEKLTFPREHGVELIFTYNNKSKDATSKSKKKGKMYRPRLLKGESGKSWDSLSQFLAEQTVEAIVIDMGPLEMLYRQNGTCPYLRDQFHPRERVRINRTVLKLLAENARAALTELGMPPEEMGSWLPPRAKRFLPRTVETEFDGRKISFKLIIITPNGFKNRLLRRLNGTVKRNGTP